MAGQPIRWIMTGKGEPLVPVEFEPCLVSPGRRYRNRRVWRLPHRSRLLPRGRASVAPCPPIAASLSSFASTATTLPPKAAASEELTESVMRGLVHHGVLEDTPDLSNCQVYACGDPLMVRKARHEFETTAGLKADQFFADPFVPSGDEVTPP